jgi:excisionase family DNA binding protein
MAEEGTVVDPITAIAAVKQTDEALGVIERLLAKLRAQPDIAAVKLSAALDEIVKTYRVVDQAFNAYASLAVDKDALTTRSQELLAIAGGSLGVQVEAGRGSCSKIGHIYQAHLKRWFERAFNQEEQLAIERAFIWPGGLGDTDDVLFCELTRLAKQLETEARDTLTPRRLAHVHHAGARSAGNGSGNAADVQAQEPAHPDCRNDLNSEHPMAGWLSQATSSCCRAASTPATIWPTVIGGPLPGQQRHDLHPRPDRWQIAAFLTVEETADLLGVGRDKVYRLIRTGQLRSIKIEKLRRISQEWITEFTSRLAASG